MSGALAGFRVRSPVLSSGRDGSSLALTSPRFRPDPKLRASDGAGEGNHLMHRHTVVTAFVRVGARAKAHANAEYTRHPEHLRGRGRDGAGKRIGHGQSGLSRLRG